MAASKPRGQLAWRAKIAWIEGYPLPGKRFQPLLARSSPVTVDAALISGTLRALRTMVREHEEETTRQLGDAREYLRRTEAVLEHLKTGAASLFGDRDLYPPAIAERARRSRAPRVVVDACSWIHATRDPREVEPMLKWIDRHAASLSALFTLLDAESALVLSIALARIDRSDALLAVLADSRTHQIALVSGAREETLAKHLVPFARELLDEDARTRRRALLLLEHLELGAWMDALGRIRGSRERSRAQAEERGCTCARDRR